MGFLFLGIEVNREDLRESQGREAAEWQKQGISFRGASSLTFGRVEFIENTMQKLRWEYLVIIGDRNLDNRRIEREGWAHTETIHDM